MNLRPPLSTREINYRKNVNVTPSISNPSSQQQEQAKNTKPQSSPSTVSDHSNYNGISIDLATAEGLLPTLEQYQAIEVEYLESTKLKTGTGAITSTGTTSWPCGAGTQPPTQTNLLDTDALVTDSSDAAFDAVNSSSRPVISENQHAYCDEDADLKGQGTNRSSRSRLETTIMSSRSFERIWMDLENPASTTQDPDSDSDFFKKFSLSPVPAHLRPSALDNEISTVTHLNTDSELILMHNNLMVASRSNMYDILSFCHLKPAFGRHSGVNDNTQTAQCEHQSLEQTLETVHTHYTFVPPELVEAFVKICPECKAGVFTSQSLAEVAIDLDDIWAHAASLDGLDDADADLETSSQSMTRGNYGYTSSRGLDLSAYASNLRLSPSPPPDVLQMNFEDDGHDRDDGDGNELDTDSDAEGHEHEHAYYHSPIPPTLALFSRFSSQSSVAMASCKSGITFSSSLSTNHNSELKMKMKNKPQSTRTHASANASRLGSGSGSGTTNISMTKGKSVPNSYEYGYKNDDSSSGPGFDSSSQTSSLGLRSLPMSREVSLFQGLPNGWQYFTDYETALRLSRVGGSVVKERNGNGSGMSMRQSDSVVEFVEKEREKERQVTEAMIEEVEGIAVRQEDFGNDGTGLGDVDEAKTGENVNSIASKTMKLHTLSASLGIGNGRRKPSTSIARSRIPNHVSPLKSGNWANSVNAEEVE